MIVRLLLCELAGLLLSNLVVPYETTMITGAATVYMGFVLCGGFFYLPMQYDTNVVLSTTWVHDAEGRGVSSAEGLVGVWLCIPQECIIMAVE